jgi:hypothetical protein
VYIIKKFYCNIFKGTRHNSNTMCLLQDSMQSNASLREGSEMGSVAPGSDNGKPSGTGSSPVMDGQYRSLYFC